MTKKEFIIELMLRRAVTYDEFSVMGRKSHGEDPNCLRKEFIDDVKRDYLMAQTVADILVETCEGNFFDNK